MKKLLTVFAATALLVSCNEKGFKMEGETTGLNDSTAVYIVKLSDDGMDITPTDTTYVVNNKFSFKIDNVEEIDVRYLQFGAKEEGMFLPFVLEKGTVKVVFDKTDNKNSKVTGTKSNDDLARFNEGIKPISDEIQAYQEKNQKVFQEAMQNGDQETMARVMQEMTEKQQKIADYAKDFITKNNESFASLMLFSNLAAQYEIEEVKKIFNGFSDEVKNTKLGKDIQKRINEVEAGEQQAAGIEVGTKAPDFSAKTPEGKETSLYENLGKVTIVDFWASWCGPCRQENPNVVALYNKFKSQGLNIVGVSLDDDETKWKDAIAKDKLAWVQVSNLMKWNDPIAKQYGVRAIPATFILDAQGVVVAKDLRGEELEAKIAELLK